jgi:carboxymethylenebutenolidase
VTKWILLTVLLQSGTTGPHGTLFKPEGNGPFPAVLYNQGDEAVQAIARVYVDRGWVFLARQPQEHGPGNPIDDARAAGRKRAFVVLAAAFVLLSAFLIITTDRTWIWVRVFGIGGLAVLSIAAVYAGGARSAAAETVHLLEGDQLKDQVAAYDWLRTQSFVDPERIAVAGNSAGGVEAVLGAERIHYCAAIDAAGAAESWASTPELQQRMLAAVRNSQAPIFFFQAENDYDVAPSLVLSAAMNEAGKPAEVRIYPAFRKSAADGHSFALLGSAKWAEDVFAFLDDYCGR